MHGTTNPKLMYTAYISSSFNSSSMNFFRNLWSTSDKYTRIKQVAWEQPKIFKCSSHSVHWKIWYVECTSLCNLTLDSPAALIMVIKEFLKFCGHKPSTFQWLFWHIKKTKIIARNDSYCWRFLYRYNFHRTYRLKCSYHYNKHVLKLKKNWIFCYHVWMERARMSEIAEITFWNRNVWQEVQCVLC
jgi:hypothetical protein